MKLSSGLSFKGEIPRMTPRNLPEGYASTCINGRLVSGDLTAWKAPNNMFVLNPSGQINSLYKMQTQLSGADVFLRSLNDVNWTKGIIVGDVNETILMTGFPDNPSTGGSLSAGTARPKFTNFPLATGNTLHTGQTAGNYPNNWNLLGSPTPVTAAIPRTYSIGNYTTYSDDSTAGYTAPAPAGHATLTTNNVMFGATNPNLVLTPDNSYFATIQETHTTSAVLQYPILESESFQFDFQLSTPNPSNQIYPNVVIKLAADVNGNGTLILFNKTNSTQSQVVNGETKTTKQLGYINVMSSGTWTTFPTSANGYGIPTQTPIDLNAGQNYTCIVIFHVDVNNITTFDLYINQYNGANVFRYLNAKMPIQPQGGYFGFAVNTEVGFTDSFNFDNVQYASSSGSNTVNSLNSESTTYVYTWENQYGMESAPSPASVTTIIGGGLGNAVVTTDPTTQQQADYALNNTGFGTKNIYRAATGSSGQTNFLYAGSIPYGTQVFNDTVLDTQLQGVLPSTNWGLPPSDGFNVLSLPNGITFMASKNSIYPSVQNQSHAYPLNYVLSTEYPIVGMSHIDNILVVLTQSYPYLVVGSDPSTLSMTKLEIPYGCVSKRSIALLKGYGVIYATANGLVAINGSGGVNLISSDYFTREQWQTLNPSSILGWVHDDRYFFYPQA